MNGDALPKHVEVNLRLRLALKDDLTIEITYIKNNDCHKIKGKLLAIEPLSNSVRLVNGEVPLDSVVEAIID